ncbi:MAG: hypothetical protein AAF862_16055, partial [Pseudomonadota bacterium]
ALPTGIGVNTVNFSNLDTPATIGSSDSIFTDVGISSIMVTQQAVSGNEFYNPGSRFGAGRALFALEDGSLQVLDEGQVADFGAPIFTINLVGTANVFGLRFADTDEAFATPSITFFNGNQQIGDTIVIDNQFNAPNVVNGEYDAQTQFGFSLMQSFTRVVINTDTTPSDGVGITDITLGTLAPIPVPPAGILMAGALGGAALLRRRAAKRA